MVGCENKKTTTDQQNEVEASTSVQRDVATTSAQVTKKDEYSTYVGKWVDEDCKVEYNSKGGTTLTIDEELDRTIAGEIKTLDIKNGNCAVIDLNGAEIKDKVIKTTFIDDNWGNSGMATLEFQGDKIVANISMSNPKLHSDEFQIQTGRIVFVKADN
jgi:hypothetical protein